LSEPLNTSSQALSRFIIEYERLEALGHPLVPQEAAGGRLVNDILVGDRSTGSSESVNSYEQITGSNRDLFGLDDATRTKADLFTVAERIIERKTSVICHVCSLF
jgi:hypothetical protein